MAALAPPFDSLTDDHDLLASDVVDFTPVREVKVFEPSFKTWPDAIAIRSVSLLKPPPPTVTLSATTQSTIPPSRFQVCVGLPPLPLARVTQLFGIDSSLTRLQGYRQPPTASGAHAGALAFLCAPRPTLTLTNGRRSRRRW
jgi:hypothetical protein